MMGRGEIEGERERGISGSEKSEKYERPGMGGWK